MLIRSNMVNYDVLLRPNEKIPVLRVTGTYLILLVKPKKNFRFSGKKIIFYVF